MAFLYQIRADGSAIQYWTLKEKPLVVGRGGHVDAYVEDDTLSSSHFLIVLQGMEYFAIDLKSCNGTWMNGSRILAHKLHPGEVIQAGQSLFCFTDCPPSTFASVQAVTSMVAAAVPAVQPQQAT
jgi:pSer/pThr/pTyr-binding forkhead associated (FHA) protein